MWARVLSLALLCAVSPTSLLPPIVLLTGTRGPRRLVAYAGGQIVGNFTVALLVFAGLAGADLSHRKPASTGALLFEIVAGLTLLGFGWRAWIRRGEAPSGKQPRWMKLVDRIGPFAGFLFGAFWINTVFAIDAGLEVARAGKSGAEAAFVLGTYAVIASGAVLFVLGVYLSERDLAEQRLDASRAWMTRHGRLALALFLCAAGVYFVAKGAAGILASS